MVVPVFVALAVALTLALTVTLAVDMAVAVLLVLVQLSPHIERFNGLPYMKFFLSNNYMLYGNYAKVGQDRLNKTIQPVHQKKG